MEQKTGERNRFVIEVANQQLDLRDWLVQVKQLGELVEIEGVHWDKEMGALTQIVHERSTSSPPALLFSKVPGYPDGFRTLYGSLSSVKRLALSLGISSEYDHENFLAQRIPCESGNYKTDSAQDSEPRADF